MREIPASDSCKAIPCKEGKKDGHLSSATAVVPAETKL